MAITISIAAGVTALTEVATVKEALGVSSATFDAIIARLIDAATDAIEEHVRHTFAKQTYIETVAGSDHPLLLLTNVPIVGTPTIICDSSPITDFVVQDAVVGSLYRQVGWARESWIGWNTEARRITGTENLNFSVTYEAGYVMPSEANRTLPNQIEQACIETVVAWYKGKARDKSVKSKKVGDLQIIYTEAMARGIPSSARALLSRRVR